MRAGSQRLMLAAFVGALLALLGLAAAGISGRLNVGIYDQFVRLAPPAPAAQVVLVTYQQLPDPTLTAALIGAVSRADALGLVLPNGLSLASDQTRVVELPADEVVFREGESAKFLHLILSGKVNVMKGDLQVKVGSAGQSETLGESSIVSELPHSATVITDGPTEIARLPVVQLRRLAARRPDIGLIVMRNLARSLGDKLRRASQVDENA